MNIWSGRRGFVSGIIALAPIALRPQAVEAAPGPGEKAWLGPDGKTIVVGRIGAPRPEHFNGASEWKTVVNDPTINRALGTYALRLNRERTGKFTMVREWGTAKAWLMDVSGTKGPFRVFA